jgi:hypothetical protein
MSDVVHDVVDFTNVAHGDCPLHMFLVFSLNNSVNMKLLMLMI